VNVGIAWGSLFIVCVTSLAVGVAIVGYGLWIIVA
jgi:hypothetical protein